MRIGVVGGGSWGTTLADLLARKGNEVVIWARESEVVESINGAHVNQLFLADCKLSEDLRASDSIEDTVLAAELVVSATPSHVVRDITSRVRVALEAIRNGAVD